MSIDEETAIRLSGKLASLTAAGKLKWLDAGSVGPWGRWPGQVFKAAVDHRTFAQIAEVPVPDSSIVSYYFGVADAKHGVTDVNVEGNSKEIFGVFAEGYPADPTERKMKLLHSLKQLYVVARDSVCGTSQRVEQFEQLLERLA